MHIFQAGKQDSRIQFRSENSSLEAPGGSMLLYCPQTALIECS